MRTTFVTPRWRRESLHPTHAVEPHSPHRPLCECMSARRHRLAACLRTHPRDESLCAPGGDGSGVIPPWCVCVSVCVCVCVRGHTRIGAWLLTHPTWRKFMRA